MRITGTVDDKWNCITVTREDLQDLLRCGRATAEKVGKDSGARIQIGRRVLYNTAKVRAYIDSLAE